MSDHARTLENLLKDSPGLNTHEIAAMKAGIAALGLTAEQEGENDA